MDLFGAMPAPSKPKLDPEQQRFRDACLKVETAKAELASYEAVFTQLRSRIAGELIPLEDQRRDQDVSILKALVVCLKKSPHALGLKTTQVKSVRSFAIHQVQKLLLREHDDALNAELEAIHDALSPEPWSAVKEAQEDLASVLNDIFGGPSDEFETDHHAEAAGDARHTAPDLKPKRTEGKPRRPSLREQKEQQAKLSVRAIFQKLVSSLHPDRELDPERREAKTQLMKEVTIAYENNDLLALLTVHGTVTDGDPSATKKVPGAEIKRLQGMLKLQLAAIKEQISAAHQELLGLSGADPYQCRVAKDFAPVFEQHLSHERTALADCINVLRNLRDPTRCRTELLAIGEAWKMLQLEEHEDFGDLLSAHESSIPRTRTRARKRKKSKQKRR